MIHRIAAALAAAILFVGATATAADLPTVTHGDKRFYRFFVRNQSSRTIEIVVYAHAHGTEHGATLETLLVRPASFEAHDLPVDGHPEPAVVRALVYNEPNLRRGVMYDRSLPYTSRPTYTLDQIGPSSFEFVNTP